VFGENACAVFDGNFSVCKNGFCVCLFVQVYPYPIHIIEKENETTIFKEKEINTPVDIGGNASSAATFAVHKLANAVDKCTVFATPGKQNGFIPKFTALIVIGFF
jgi:hypothetical protein